MTATALAVDDQAWRQDPWLGVNPLDPAFRANPYPLLKRLREHDPVNETPIGLFRLTRYDDVVRMIKEVPAGVRFSDGNTLSSTTLPGGPGQCTLQQDPPDHTRLRKLMNQAFRPRAIDRLRERVEVL